MLLVIFYPPYLALVVGKGSDKEYYNISWKT